MTLIYSNGGGDLAKTVKLNDELVEFARQEAVLQDRSLGAQVSHWVRIGRAVETSGKLDHAKISAVLAGEMQTRELTPEEKSVWMDQFTDLMGEPGPEEKGFFADRRRRGLCVGLDEKGNLVHAEPDPAA